MIELANITTYETCEKYWFCSSQIEPTRLAIIEKETYNIIGSITEYDPVDENDIFLYDGIEYDEQIIADFVAFKNRPEYMLWTASSWLTTPTSLVDAYETLLIGSIFERYTYKHIVEKSPYDVDAAMHSVEKCITWLRSTDFYTCPASTQYHESEECGLLKHTLKVVHRILQLKYTQPFQSVSLSSAVFTALVHDWCKIGLYESYTRNVKNETTGKWEAKLSYKYRSESLTSFGHGVSSMFLASRFTNLSVEEALAIRWHMAAWRVVDSEMNELQQSNETYPLVHLLQFADQLAIVKYDPISFKF